MSPGRAQTRLALAVLLIAFFITEGPLSPVQVGLIDAFVPAYVTAMFVNDSITAVLLFAQFPVLRSHAPLAIASGYLHGVRRHPSVLALSSLLCSPNQSDKAKSSPETTKTR